MVEPVDEANALATGSGLPSARLARLAALTVAQLAAERPNAAVVLTDSGGDLSPDATISDAAMADVLAAVDASTARNTKAAYASDWSRFTGWCAERRYSAVPADPLVGAHYVTEAATEEVSVGKWRYAPATLTRWVSSINQFHTAAGFSAPGHAEVVRRALSGIRRIRSTPAASVTVAARRHPVPAGADHGVGRSVAGRGSCSAGRRLAADGFRRCQPAQ